MHLDLSLYEAVVNAVSDTSGHEVSDTSGHGVCASCTFIAGSTAQGCTIKLQNDEHMFVFSMSRQSSDKLVLECFSVPEAGVFRVHSYEIHLGEVKECTRIELPNIIIEKMESEKALDV